MYVRVPYNYALCMYVMFVTYVTIERKKDSVCVCVHTMSACNYSIRYSI